MSLKVGALAGLIALCFSLLSLAVFLRSDVYVRYQAELAQNAKYCEAEGSAEERYKEEYCQSLLYRTASDPAAFYTFGLLVATLMLFVATYLLYSAAIQQGADAKKAIAVTRETAKTQLRAYMSVDEAVMVQDWPSTNVNIKLTVKNYGQTPAYNVRSYAQPGYGGANQTPYDDVFEPGSESIVGPGASITISGNVALTEEKLGLVRDGTCRIFIWGRVSYKDAFGNDRFFSFRGYNEAPTTKLAPDRTTTFLRFGVSPAPNGYQAN